MGMRRANGTGTVYKKKDKPRRKPYVAEITVGWGKADLITKTCRRKSKIIGYFEKSKDAWDALTEYGRNPTKFDSKNITFGELWEQMVEEKKKQNLDIDGTYNMTKSRCKVIFSVPIQNLKTMHLQNIIDTSKLGAGGKKRMKVLINATFKIAYENDIIDKNYAELIKIPESEQSTIHQPFTSLELQTLWKNTDNDVVKIMLIYIYTGARPSELLQMPIRDINLTERYMVGGMKTKAGKNRSIPIAECIFPFVKYFYTKYAFTKDAYLFTEFKAPTPLKFAMYKACAKTHIPNHLPHDCRHTFITMSDNYGLSEKTIKLIVGHSRGAGTTQAVYTHKTVQQLIAAVNTLPYGEKMTIDPTESVSSGAVVI